MWKNQIFKLSQELERTYQSCPAAPPCKAMHKDPGRLRQSHFFTIPNISHSYFGTVFAAFPYAGNENRERVDRKEK
jgi:hypothetical protein